MSKHEEATMTVEGNAEVYKQGNTTLRIVQSPEHMRIKKRIRDCRMTFTVTDDELEQVREQMEKVGFTNFSAFCRKMLIDGLVVNMKIPGLEDALQLLYEEGHQINMATKRINSSVEPEQRDVEILVRSINKIKETFKAIVDQLEVDENPLE